MTELREEIGITLQWCRILQTFGVDVMIAFIIDAEFGAGLTRWEEWLDDDRHRRMLDVFTARLDRGRTGRIPVISVSPPPEIRLYDANGYPIVRSSTQEVYDRAWQLLMTGRGHLVPRMMLAARCRAWRRAGSISEHFDYMMSLVQIDGAAGTLFDEAEQDAREAGFLLPADDLARMAEIARRHRQSLAGAG